jgi:hypothetical protein
MLIPGAVTSGLMMSMATGSGPRLKRPSRWALRAGLAGIPGHVCELTVTDQDWLPVVLGG